MSPQLALDPFAPDVLHPAVDPNVREWRLVIQGAPVAKGRPKLGTVNGHAMAFTPKKTRNYESIVRETAVREWNRPILQNVPVTMHSIFFLPIAQSWPKKRQQAARFGVALPIAKPDLSNLAKAIEDGMNGVVYYDDSLLVKTTNEKRYADSPRVEIVLTW